MIFANQPGITCELAGRISVQGIEKLEVKPYDEKEFRPNIGTPKQNDTTFSFTSCAQDPVTASATWRKSHAKYRCLILNVGPLSLELLLSNQTQSQITNDCFDSPRSAVRSSSRNTKI
jgi:hypothetical protein